MSDSTWLFIAFCWIAWATYWVAMAFQNKRTIERGGFLGYRLVALLLVAVLLAVVHLVHASSRSRLWQTGIALGIVTDCIVLAGAAFSIWARVTLGRNWSAEVTFKQDHELIESGPYALARHPIYTGMLAMALGTALNYGRVLGFVLLCALCAAFWWKAREEERIMSRHFPDAYPEYRARVHAIIPFLL
jgi:protein-S-isoprenylcysteine O-methyltransferase Ste14